MNTISKISLISLGTIFFLFSQVAKSEKLDLDSSTNVISYALGVNFGTSIKAQDLNINIESIIAGLKSGLGESESLLTPEQMNEAFQKIEKKIQENQRKKQAQSALQNLSKGLIFLAENKKKDGVKVTGSGLQYEIIKEGTGKKPKTTDTVTVHYSGRLINGTEFDSSYKRGTPATFPLNQVIKGWSEAVQLMSPGAKYLVTIPAELAYGENAPPAIGPNQVLIFDIELISIADTEEQSE